MAVSIYHIIFFRSVYHFSNVYLMHCISLDNILYGYNSYKSHKIRMTMTYRNQSSGAQGGVKVVQLNQVYLGWGVLKLGNITTCFRM